MTCLLSQLQNDTLIDLVPKLHGGLISLWPLLHLPDVPFDLRTPACYGALRQQYSSREYCSCAAMQTTFLQPLDSSSCTRYRRSSSAAESTSWQTPPSRHFLLAGCVFNLT